MPTSLDHFTSSREHSLDRLPFRRVGWLSGAASVLALVGMAGCATDGSGGSLGGQGGTGGRGPSTVTGTVAGRPGVGAGTAGNAGTAGRGAGGETSGGATNGGDTNGGDANGGDANGGDSNSDGPDASVPIEEVGSCGRRDDRDYGDRFTSAEVPDASVPMELPDAGADGGVSTAPTDPLSGWPAAKPNGLTLQILSRDTGQDSVIAADFGLTNGTDDDISLDDVTFRYYYVAGFVPVVEVDYAAITQPSHQAITDDVIRTVTPDYVEFSFDDDITFPENGVLTIQTRMHSSDYQAEFDKCESFSFDDVATTLDDYPYVPVFYEGELVYGIQPVLAP